MSAEPTHEPHPGFAKAAERARQLLDEFQELEGQLSYATTGNIRARLKGEALDLLTACGTPPPLVVLVGSLLKDRRQDKLPWAKDRFTRAQRVAARIEAGCPLDPKGRRPSNLNHSALHRKLVKEMGKNAPDRTTIRKWDEDPEYERLVMELRPDIYYTPYPSPDRSVPPAKT